MHGNMVFVTEVRLTEATELRQVTALRAEIAELGAGHPERDQKFLDIVHQLATGLNEVEACVHKAIEARVTRSEADICIKISERFGELRGWISAIDPAQVRAKSGQPFKFANERDRDDEVPELPNFLPARAIN